MVSGTSRVATRVAADNRTHTASDARHPINLLASLASGSVMVVYDVTADRSLCPADFIYILVSGGFIMSLT